MRPAEQTRAALTVDEFHAAAERNKQWGRWGPDDEIGTLNNVTPAHVAAATALARTGKSFSLAMDFNRDGPQRARPGSRRFNPVHTMIRSGVDCCNPTNPTPSNSADDIITMPLQSATQWDALSHCFYYDKMWNGYDARLVSGDGAAKCAIDKTRNRMTGRGVLLDMARHLGVDCLPDGYGISIAELEACEAVEGVAVGAGDFLLIRTGTQERWEATGAWGVYVGGPCAGLKLETIDWLRDRDIAAVATDTFCVEVNPGEVEGVHMPFHWLAIPLLGLTLGEMFRLKELAADCAEDGVYEFLFCAPPLPVSRAVGSPINPIAIK